MPRREHCLRLELIILPSNAHAVDEQSNEILQDVRQFTTLAACLSSKISESLVGFKIAGACAGLIGIGPEIIQAVLLCPL